MRRFLSELAIFGLIQLGILAYFLHGVSNRSNEFLAATVDKERLLATAPGERVIFVGGSNLAFGVDTAEIGRRLGRTPVNMGVNAGLGLPFILEEAQAGVRAGDLVVFSPEYDHFTTVELRDGVPSVWNRLFVINGASLRHASWRNRWIGLFDNANGLVYFRNVLHYWAGNEPTTVPPYQRGLFNANGDLALPREHEAERAKRIEQFTRPVNHELAKQAMSRVQRFVSHCQAQNVRVICALPALSREGARIETLREIEAMLAEVMPVVVGSEESLLPLECFYDSYYHLTTKGVQLRTQLLSERLALAAPAQEEKLAQRNHAVLGAR